MHIEGQRTNWLRRAFSVMLLALLVVGFGSGVAWAASVDGAAKASSAKVDKISTITISVENNFDGKGNEPKIIEPLRELEVGRLAPQSFDDAPTYSYDAAVLALRNAMANRETEYEFVINSSEEFGPLATRILVDALAEDGNSTHGDYLALVYNGATMSGRKRSNGEDNPEGAYKYDVIYSIRYKTTLDQEQWLCEQVDQVLENMNLDGMTAYQKSRAIYDFICSNVTYDYDHLADESYLPQFTAYAAMMDHTAVCQGYASLFYLMAGKAGLNVRCVSGWGVGSSGQYEPHAWNIVQLDDGYWYNVDSTWDSSAKGSYSYFLKNEADFLRHQRGVGSGNQTNYASDEFYAAYPMSPTSYDVPNQGGFVANSLTLRGNVGVNFYVSLSDDLVQSGDVYMTFTKPNGQVCRVDYDEDETGTLSDGSTVYEFTCEVSAKEMKDQVLAELHASDGSVLSSMEYSAAEYCFDYLYMPSATPLGKRLVTSMMNYGAMSQLYFGYNTDNLANEGLYDDEKALGAVDASALTARNRADLIEDSGISYYGTSLLLKSNTVIRHYFELDEGADISEYTFSYFNWDGETLTVQPKKSGNLYYVEIANVYPFLWNYMFHLDVFKGSNEALWVEYGLQSYIKNALTNPDLANETALADCAKALYWYGYWGAKYVGIS